MQQTLKIKAPASCVSTVEKLMDYKIYATLVKTHNTR